MTAPVETLQTVLDGSHEALPTEVMPDIADALAAMEEQLEELPTDRRSILLDEKQRLLNSLLAEHTAESVINEIIYLASLYKNRTKERELEDGTKLYMWGTRDPYDQYLMYKYYVQTHPSGQVDYTVLETTAEGQTTFTIHDDGQYTVHHRAARAAGYEHFRPVQLDNARAEAALRGLFDTSLVTAGIVRGRSPEANKKADVHAEGMLGGSTTDQALYEARDERDVYIALQELTASRELPREVLQLTGQTAVNASFRLQ